MKKLFLSLLMILTSLGVASCSSFVGDDETIIIKDVKQELGKNENGEEGFYIIIEYDNDAKKPDKFFVPNGKKGETGLVGNGIKDVKSSIDEVTKETTVTITFTDESMKPVEYKVPIGVAMKDVTTTVLEDGSTSCVINFTDGSQSEPIILPKGEKGDGFEKYESKVNEDGSQELKLYFTNQDPIIVTIPAPSKGDTGKGIESIVSSTIDGQYVISIMLTGEEQPKIFKFDAPNTWHKGTGRPYDGDGKDGDFFFDIEHKIIYAKENDAWVEVIKLETTTPAEYTITFDLNDSDKNAFLPTGYNKTVKVKEGTYFGQNGKSSLPIPVREGYTFNGWYLTTDPLVINGRFTDTTPIYSNLTLYANWIKQ